MRPRLFPVLGAASVALFFIILGLAVQFANADEPGRFGRLFRFKQPSAASTPHEISPPDSLRSPVRNNEASESTPSPSLARLVPQARTSQAATEADPVVTRISLARSDDGKQFGMFLQVYADGTVIESGGTHSVGRQAIKEVIEALEASELYRVKGHCGGPATDFVEQVQMVVYERSMRGIRANAFSFSGNTQGCSHPVQHLQKALDNLQNKVSKNTSSMGEPSSGGNMMATNPLNTDPATRPAPILLNAEPGSSR